MQSNNDQKSKLDDDILQCKEDLQKVLKAAGRTLPSPAPSPSEPPTRPTATIQAQPEPFDPLKEEPESPSQPVSAEETPDFPNKIHIPSFEALQKEKNEPNSAFFDPLPPTEPDNRLIEIERLEKDLAETRRKLASVNQQAQEETAQLSAQAQHLQQVINQKDADQKQLTEQAEDQHQQMESLQQKLADTQTRLETYKNQAEENAAAITSQAQQLRQAIEEKNLAQNQLAAQTGNAQQRIEAMQQELAQKTDALAALKQQADENIAAVASQLQKTAEANEAAQKQYKAQSDIAQQRIVALEQDITEAIGRISAFKQQAEENAALLTAQAQQIRQAADEKEAAQKHFEGLTLEWTQTVDDLKTAQKDAAQLLQRRQGEIEALHEELVQANIGLEKANTDNLIVIREKMEMASELEELKQQQTVEPEFEMDRDDENLSDDQMPEPYCEPVEEVISEDDVHIEQKLAPDPIPSHNLAEQIMAVQRNSSAVRRRPPEKSGKTNHSGSIEHVMQGYISSVNSPSKPTDNTPSLPANERTERFERWQGESLSEYQESLLGSIVRKDILRFCGSNSILDSKHQPMVN